jgi:2-polyprenyl-3-methyl-5-hydroxy-6-metoxy-1,4-benzoquinol methylase
LGRVTDAGCGRGQFGLLLKELGQLDALSGFDFDARKVDVANQAAAGQAEFSAAALDSAEWPDADTVLLMDVLHYVAPDEQRAALKAAADSLAPGGRLVVREVNNKPSFMSRLTRMFERIATRTGYNQVKALSFSSRQELTHEIERTGLSCASVKAFRGLANELIVAQKAG